MTVLTPARRVYSFDDIVEAGDYWLTTVEYKTTGSEGQVGEVPEVFFLLPIHTGFDKYDHSRPGCGIHGVTQPPWTFRECADGSLEIRASIACGRSSPGGEYWHGYLDEGNTWRQV
jgi:hypothetical protein